MKVNSLPFENLVKHAKYQRATSQKSLHFKLFGEPLPLWIKKAYAACNTSCSWGAGIVDKNGGNAVLNKFWNKYKNSSHLIHIPTNLLIKKGTNNIFIKTSNELNLINVSIGQNIIQSIKLQIKHGNKYMVKKEDNK